MHGQNLIRHFAWRSVVLMFSLIFVASTGAPADAFGPASPLGNPSAPIIIKKRTPLDQPLAEILPINVNTTDAETLMKVPGINRTAARQIVNHRDRYGRYTSLDQLIGFSGIDKMNISRLKNYLSL